MPLLSEINVDGVEGVAGPPQSDITLAEAREACGPELTLWGGIPQDFLVTVRTEKEFKTAVHEATQQSKGDGRMILGIADRVSVDADFGRLEAVARLIEEVASGRR